MNEKEVEEKPLKHKLSNFFCFLSFLEIKKKPFLNFLKKSKIKIDIDLKKTFLTFPCKIDKF